MTFQQLLDKTKRTQYTDKSVVNSVDSCDPQDIEFFTLGKYVSDDQLEKEYQKRGLVPAHPYALTLYSLDHQKEMDEKNYVGTHWKDNGWCYVAFRRWGDDERDVSVGRSDCGWGDFWWFAGVRKYQELGSLEPKPFTEPLEISIESIKINGKVYKLIEE